MTGMTLKNFIQIVIDYDEIEFSYRGIEYNFQKELAEDGDAVISIWQGGENPKCCYSVKVPDDKESFKAASKNLVDAKIFFDNKSIVEGEKNIHVEFFT